VMAGQVIVNVYGGFVPVQPLESVTVTTIGKAPLPLGVPESVPLAASVRPVGSVEEVVNVAVPMAPLCVKLIERGVPAGLLVVAGLATVMVGRLMAGVEGGRVPVRPLPAVTLTVIGKEPVTVGVPDRRPALESVSPAGSEPLLSEKVAPPMAPDCVKVWLKA